MADSRTPAAGALPAGFAEPLTAVVPVRDAGARLAALLACLEGVPTIVVDGGSIDESAQIARMAGATVIETAPGRGGQLAAGADAAREGWLLFLHADCVLGSRWRDAVATHLASEDGKQRAAVFTLRFDDSSWPARVIAAGAMRRTRSWGLPYGDQGLLIHASLYRDVGGYRALPLMEDVDLMRRLGRRRLAILDVPIVTSAERYRRDGHWRRAARNLVCLGLYFLGVDPARIKRFYER